MKLAEFIDVHRKRIIEEWTAFARSLLPPDSEATESLLSDHADEILAAIVVDLRAIRAGKARGHRAHGLVQRVGTLHTTLRFESGFALDRLTLEYRALRASVLRSYSEVPGAGDAVGVTRFNEAIDEALAEATSRYVEIMVQRRDQFVGAIGHDLRNPLGAVIMGASILATRASLDEGSSKIAARILNSARRMDRLVADILDLTRMQLGSTVPIALGPADLGQICRQSIAELQSGHPEPIGFVASGDLEGEWDGDRLTRVVSNLVANAMQHGSPHAPIRLSARGEGDAVVLDVHDDGPPIAKEVLRELVEPMVSHARSNVRSATFGLGLHVAQQVIVAHGGALSVRSTKTAGTTFTVRLPRAARVDRAEGAPSSVSRREPPSIRTASSARPARTARGGHTRRSRTKRSS